MRRAFVTCIVIMTLCASVVMADDDESREEMLRYGKRLQSLGIEPTKEHIETLLRSLEPSDEQRTRVANWLVQLGANDYREREEATRLLIASPIVSDDELQKTIEGDDDEASWRAKYVLEARAEGVIESNVVVALQFIGAGGAQVAVEPIMTAVRMFDRPPILDAARVALIRTVTANNVELLKPYLSSESARERDVAMRSLLEIAPNETDWVFRQMANDEAGHVRLHLAIHLARASDRRSLGLLVELVQADDASFSDRASRALRSLTGTRYGYSSHLSDVEREAAIDGWQMWLAQNEDTFELLPFQSRLIHGRTLIALYSPGKVVELDEKGNVVWEIALPSAFACQGLENGNRLIAQYSSGRIVEYDPSGELVWEVSGLPGNLSGIARLPNGNTLVAAGQAGNVVFELNSDGDKVWEITVNGSPCHAARLENGRTLLSLMGENKVVEVNREGEILWELSADGQPYFSERLENGNTLVRFSGGGVAEYDREGKKVWEAECGAGYTVQRLEDGNTMIPSQEGIKIVSPSGVVVSENKNYTGYLYVHQY